MKKTNEFTVNSFSFLVVLLVAVVLLASCGSESAKDVTEVASAPVTKDVAQDEDKATKEQSMLELTALGLMEDSFGDSMSIQFKKENQTFILTPISEDFSVELVQILGGTKSHSDWKAMSDGMITLSEGMKNMLGSGYTLMVANPMNADNIILSITDGVVLYDIFNE